MPLELNSIHQSRFKLEKMPFNSGSVQLYDRGLQLVTKARKNMKPRLVKLIDKILLRKRSLIESVNDQLKNICQIEHSRHRSGWNFLVNLVAGLIAYTYQPKLPSLDLQPKGLPALPPAIF